jgi:hypothetical protein
MAEEIMANGTNRFVYLGRAAHQNLPGKPAVGVLMTLLEHEQRDAQILAKCLAGPPVVVRNAKQVPLEIEVDQGEIASITRVQIEPSPEVPYGAESEDIESKALASMCLHALKQCALDPELSPIIGGWVAKCGLPPSQNEVALSLWLAAALAHQEPPAVRQQLLENTTAQRLRLFLPSLQGSAQGAHRP